MSDLGIRGPWGEEVNVLLMIAAGSIAFVATSASLLQLVSLSHGVNRKT